MALWTPPITPALAEKLRRTLNPAAGAVTMCEVSDELEPNGFPEEGEEEVDGLPVLVEARPIEPLPPAPTPAVQTAAAAATGFVAGAATVALMMRRQAKKIGRLQAAAAANGDGGPLPGVRTFLVHVHVLGRPGDESPVS